MPDPITAGLLIAGGVGTTLLGEAFRPRQRKKPMTTPEQDEARRALLDAARVGGFGDVRFGEMYDRALGDYEMTGVERGALARMYEMMGRELPAFDLQRADLRGLERAHGALDLKEEELRRGLTTDFYDPMAEEGIYATYRKQAMREHQELGDDLRRQMAITGGLYGTATGQEMGLLAERTADRLQQKLLGLGQREADRRIQMAGMAGQLGGQRAGLMQAELARQDFDLARQRFDVERTARVFEMGGLERILRDKQAKERYAEWTRARGERLMPLELYGRVAGITVPWGVDEIVGDNPFAASGGQIAGIGLGRLLG